MKLPDTYGVRVLIVAWTEILAPPPWVSTFRRRFNDSTSNEQRRTWSIVDCGKPSTIDWNTRVYRNTAFRYTYGFSLLPSNGWLNPTSSPRYIYYRRSSRLFTIAHLQRYEIFNIITVTVRRDWYHNRINYNRRIVSNCVYERAGEGRGGSGKSWKSSIDPPF